MNIKNYVFFIYLLLLSITVYSQNEKNNINSSQYELIIGTDNDNFIVYTSTDRNYTYGVNGSFKWKPKEKLFGKLFNESLKHYQQIGLNIKGYTPEYLDENDNNDIERPFAGWSYINYESAYMYQKSFFKIGVDVGVIGPASQVEDLQNWVHKNITNDSIVNWMNQIPNQLGVNVRGEYSYSLYSNSWFNVYNRNNVSVGNIFTYLQPKLNFRFGKFNSITESIATNNRIFAPKNKTEIFFEYGVGYKLSLYNATVQGNIFDSNRQDNIDINHHIFTMHLGLNVSIANWGLNFNYIYSTGEFEYTNQHRYGSIGLFYEFR